MIPIYEQPVGVTAGRTQAAARSLHVMSVLAIAIFTMAHVGNSNAYYEGSAGPYGIRVLIRTPGVIPGLAQITVRITSGEGVRHVTVRPLRSDAGLEGAPPADTAVAVDGDPDLYGAELWLMNFGSYSVHVTVEGDAGSGTVFVPVMALAERRLAMSLPMGIALIGAGLFLFVGALTIFGAAARESVLPPGEEPDTKRISRGRVAMAGGGVVLALALVGGRSWWDDVDAAYRSNLFRPLSTVATIDRIQRRRILTLAIDDAAWLGRNWTPLIPDHGKLMHMFVVRDGDLSAMAHLHPVSTDSNTFRVSFPTQLPPGGYRIYADIVHESGFVQTLTDTVIAPSFGMEQSRGADLPLPPIDPDDSWAWSLPFGAAASASSRSPSGRTLVWEGHQLTLAVGEELTMRFSMTDADGSPAELEPYLGMMGHAAITRRDGSWFVHLHPTGTINMAAKMRFERVEGDVADSSEAAGMAPTERTGSESNVVTFPFVFQEPGQYRIWVQLKTSGAVDTGTWDFNVNIKR